MDPERLDDRYELLEEVGSGGMATVYRGLDHRLGGREVALKVLHPHLSVRKQARIRFQNEADAAAGLEHENILKVYDVAPIGSAKSYIVMEFVRGETLTRLVEEHPLTIPEIGVMIAHEVTRAVEHAHTARILHRDVKPENVMIREDGVVKLMDFGIARALDTSRMTMTGALMGSPAHMSPEHIEGKELDFRADVFSLGTLLYYLATGDLPFNAPSPHALLRKILEGDYPPAERANPAVGRPLSSIIDKALARDRKARYSSASALLSDLQTHLKKLGIDDPTAELKDWNNRPAPYEKELRKRLTARILELADRAARQNRRALALSHLNRVICLDENNTRALKMLETLHVAQNREKEARKGLIWIAVGLASAITCIVIYAGWVTVMTAPPEGTVSEDRPTGDAINPPAPTLANKSTTNPRITELEMTRHRRPAEDLNRLPATPAEASANSRNTREKSDTAASAAPARYPVRILVSPPLARLTLDGRAFTKLPKDPFQLTAGIHRTRIEIPNCDECAALEKSFKVHPDKPNPAQRLQARLKDARLRIDTANKGRVLIDGFPAGSTNEVLRIPIPYTANHRRKGRRVKLKVIVEGHAPHLSEITLQPGKFRAEKVTIRRAPRRPSPLPKGAGQGAMAN